MIYLHCYDLNKYKDFNAKGRLQENLSHYLKVAVDKLQITHNENGKPSIQGLKFSITHSKHWHIQAFTSSGEIGIDCEYINVNRNYLKLAKRFFHKQEFEKLKALEKTKARKLFYDLWTAKEAVCKAEGGRLWYYLNENYLTNTRYMKKTNKGFYINHFREINNFSLCIAHANNDSKFEFVNG